MDISEMNKIKKELKLTYKQISDLSGVPLSTVQKVLGGITDSPKYSTVKALSDVLLYESRKENPLATYHYSDYTLGNNPERDNQLYDLVEEARHFIHGTSVEKMNQDKGFSQDGKRLMTVEDYETLEDDKRVELINGVFYDMATPSAEHQLIAGRIYSQIETYIMQNHGKCIPIIAPFDVQVKKDNYNMVEPDVMIICDKSKIQKNKVFGAPDLAVEIVSKTSGSHDRITKLALYMNAGVREYWIVDPIAEEIIVYHFEKTYMPEHYSFNDKVKVGIYDGKCEIDFGSIREYIKEKLG